MSHILLLVVLALTLVACPKPRATAKPPVMDKTDAVSSDQEPSPLPKPPPPDAQPTDAK
jgi:hypothetical protein